jgi:drug/metabolite transporter (DMT)-like permease
MLEPVGAAVLGWLWFAEDLAGLQVLGIAVVLTGIALAQTARVVRAGPDVILRT